VKSNDKTNGQLFLFLRHIMQIPVLYSTLKQCTCDWPIKPRVLASTRIFDMCLSICPSVCHKNSQVSVLLKRLTLRQGRWKVS